MSKGEMSPVSKVFENITPGTFSGLPIMSNNSNNVFFSNSSETEQIINSSDNEYHRIAITQYIPHEKYHIIDVNNKWDKAIIDSERGEVNMLLTEAEHLKMGHVSDKYPLYIKINDNYLFRINRNKKGAVSNNVYSFTIKKIDGRYVVSDLDKPESLAKFLHMLVENDENRIYSSVDDAWKALMNINATDQTYVIKETRRILDELINYNPNGTFHLHEEVAVSKDLINEAGDDIVNTDNNSFLKLLTPRPFYKNGTFINNVNLEDLALRNPDFKNFTSSNIDLFEEYREKGH